MIFVKPTNKILAVAMLAGLLQLATACVVKPPQRPGAGAVKGGGDASPTPGNPDPGIPKSGDPSTGSTQTTNPGTQGGQTPDPNQTTSNGPLTPANDLPTPVKGQGVLVKVANKCPFSLWIHAAGAQATLQPDDVELKSNTVRSYEAPALWQSARVEAYTKGPRQDQRDKVEMTFDHPAQTVNLNYNVTYVDWVGLPVKVGSIGAGPDCKASGCERPVAKLLEGCPEGLNDGERCISARTFCLDPKNQGSSYCHLLDAKIDECVNKYDDCKGAAGSKTPDVYACSGAFFSQNPKYCAAINRGMLDDPTNTDTKLYHTNPPFNNYSKWVHDICPGIYALAYDDFPPAAEESGFHACVDGTELDVTFCPGG